jgi:hypothetical protein
MVRTKAKWLHPKRKTTGIKWQRLGMKHMSEIPGDNDNHRETTEPTPL